MAGNGDISAMVRPARASFEPQEDDSSARKKSMPRGTRDDYNRLNSSSSRLISKRPC